MATQDLTAYTEVDTSSRLTVTSSTVTVSSLVRQETAYVYKDFGEDYFAVDFSFRFQINVSAIDDGFYFSPFCLADVLETINTMSGDTYVYVALYRSGANFYCVLTKRSGGFYPISDSTLLSTSTDYYFEIARVGTSCSCDIYSDSGYSSLVDSLAVTLESGDAYQYFYPMNCSVVPGNTTTGSSAFQDYELFIDAIYQVPLLELDLGLQVPAYSPVSKNVPVLALALELQTPALHLFYEVPALGLDLLLPAPTTTHRYNAPALGLDLDLGVPTLLTSLAVPLLSLDLALETPTYVWDDLTGRGTVVYYCVLTGAEDGLDDVSLPLENFQSRLRSGEPSYLQVTIPDPYTYGQSVTDRLNGEIVVYRGVRYADGSETLGEIARANLETISDDRGNNSSSITLVGHKQTTTATPKSRSITGLTYWHSGTGARRATMAKLDTFLRPGDTAVFPEMDDASFTVGLISYVVSTTYEQMALTEDV